MHRRAPDSGMRNPPVSRAGSRLEMVFPAPLMMMRLGGVGVKAVYTVGDGGLSWLWFRNYLLPLPTAPTPRCREQRPTQRPVALRGRRGFLSHMSNQDVARRRGAAGSLSPKPT